LAAALFVQVSHEATHGIAALLVGARWQAFNLFGVESVWPGQPNEWGDVVIAGSAAIINILVGIVCVALFSAQFALRRPLLRLLLLYTGAYSLLTGFGYIFFDPLFYSPQDTLGDWRRIVSTLGGGWEVRIPLILIGAAGVLWVFFWLPKGALKFGERTDLHQNRVAVALPVLLVPYLAVNLIFTVLAFWHPVGPQGVIIVVLHYWSGYIAFFWAFFLAAYWLEVKAPPANPTPLPQAISWPWVIGSIAALAVSVALLLPTIYFFM
jgi:hypothetical protein